MKYSEPGVIGESSINFTIPSDFARSALYCCPEVGYFYCDSQYDIRRENYNWFLMSFICKGSLTFQTEGMTFQAKENDVVLLDCRAPHRYFCEDHAEFYWFHFFGSSSSEYVDYLLSQRGALYSGPQIGSLRQSFDNIFRQAGTAIVNEHLISREISSIFCSLATSQRSSALIHSPIVPVLTYISMHFSEPVDLDQMAEMCMISKPHLIRLFKKELNCTPHDYLLDFRLRQAKQFLTATSHTVEEIAEECGFNSVSHFSRAFRKRIHMTPSEFRNLW